ncbi:MAG TPA: response regulator [Cytophagaceae bacterium]
MRAFNSVLLIDDDPVSNFMVLNFFKKTNLTRSIKCFKNGKEGLDYLKQNQGNLPDLILLDVNMPVMDGYEFLDEFEKLRINKERINIVLFTTDERELENTNKYGIDKIIIKPLTMEKFSLAIENTNW